MTLSDTLYITEENEPFDMVQLLAQGAAVGALIGLLMPIIGMLSHPRNGYNILYTVFLPMYLAGGMLFGAIEGIIIWSCMTIAGHRLNVTVRTAIAMAGLAILLVALNLLSHPSPYAPEASETGYVFAYVSFTLYAVLFGLVTGTGFQPLRALVSETTASRYRVLSVITGFALRVFVVFALMESILYLLWTQIRSLGDAEVTFAVFAFSHFIAAAVIVFAKVPFHRLVTIGLIVNFPVVVFTLNALKDQEQVPIGFITFAYLTLWAAFVVSRLPAWLGAES